MTSASSAVSGSTVLPGEQAERLAQMLRDSRVSVVLGSPDSGMSALLERMRPGRRAIDRAPSGIRRDGGVIYLPERRSNVSVCDVAIHFDAWGDEPLRALSRRIDAALVERFGAFEIAPAAEVDFGWLADKLLAACRRWNVRFLFVLDAFEVHLAASRTHAGIAAFDDELIETIKTNVLPANFLFALSDRAAPALERFRDRIVGFPEESLVLPALRDADRPPALRVVSQPTSEAAPSDETPVAGHVAQRPAATSPIVDAPARPDASMGEAPVAVVPTAGPPLEAAATGAPIVEEPVVETPEAEAPVVEPPLAEVPVMEAPVAEALVIEAPVADAPVVEPTDEAPVVEPPVAEAPVVEAPAAEALVIEASVANAPVVEPTDEAPVVELQAAEAPVVEPVVPEAPLAEPLVAEGRAEAPVVETVAAAAPLRWAEHSAAASRLPDAVPLAAFVVPPTSADRPRRHRVVWLLLLVGVAAAWIAWSLSSESKRDGPPIANIDEYRLPPPSISSPPAAVAPAPVPALPTPPVHAFLDLLIDPDSGIDAQVATELRERVARSAGLDLSIRPATHWADGFDAQAEQGQLSIVRYDALRAARNGRRIHPPQIVMPLYTEPVYVIARSEAPITYVHELEGQRINTGPLSSARGMTAARLYRDLFETEMLAGDATFDTAESGLAKLVDDRGVDAVVVVGSELDSLFRDKPPEWKAHVKLLRIDPANRASRRAARSFLITPAGVGTIGDPGGDDKPGLAEVAFLVAAEPIDPSMAAALGDFARSLCANLPGLQRDGHPKWREVQVGARLDVGWPYVPAVQEAFRSCQFPRSPVATAGHP